MSLKYHTPIGVQRPCHHATIQLNHSEIDFFPISEKSTLISHRWKTLKNSIIYCETKELDDGAFSHAFWRIFSQAPIKAPEKKGIRATTRGPLHVGQLCPASLSFSLLAIERTRATAHTGSPHHARAAVGALANLANYGREKTPRFFEIPAYF